MEPVPVRNLLVLVGSAALVVSTAALPSSADGHAATPPASVAAGPSDRGGDLGFYDARRAVSPARRSLGSDTLFETDPTTGTVRVVEKLDGYLTGPSRRPARSVAL